MERWPEERVVEFKQRQAQSSLERFHEHQAALALLAVRDKEAYERTTAEERERRAAQQRSRRARNKRPTWRQACDLLNQLEAEVAQQLPRTDNGGDKALKYGTIRPPLVADMIRRLKLKRGRLFVDAGGGLGLVSLLIALTSGADVVSIEIRPELHALAVELARRVAAVCARRRWLGVGRWTLVQGDARHVLRDESLVWATSAADDDEPIVVAIGDDAHLAVRCLYTRADCLFLNNWAFDEGLSIELLREYGRLAPIGGQAAFLRNPLPRYRPGSAVGDNAALALYALPATAAEVFDVPAGGIDWRDAAGVHWTALSVLPLGVRQSRNAVIADEFRMMSPSILP